VGNGTAEAVGGGVGVVGGGSVGGSVIVNKGVAEAVSEARRAVGTEIVGVAVAGDWQPHTANKAINPMILSMRYRRDSLTMESLCG